MSILIIDDEEDTRESLREVLEMAGHKVLTAASGNEALEYVKSEDIRLMLVDFAMPEMSGEDFLRRVWAKNQWPPAIVITGIAPWRTLGLIELGVGYVRKPINSNILLGMIDSYLKKGGQRWE
jgi:DNA-binding response OmpR family regulator